MHSWHPSGQIYVGCQCPIQLCKKDYLLLPLPVQGYPDLDVAFSPLSQKPCPDSAWPIFQISTEGAFGVPVLMVSIIKSRPLMKLFPPTDSALSPPFLILQNHQESAGILPIFTSSVELAAHDFVVTRLRSRGHLNLIGAKTVNLMLYERKKPVTM